MQDQYIMRNNKRLRCGYTTGSCAAAAAKAAAMMLFSHEVCSQVELATPSGRVLAIDIVEQELASDYVQCGVVKDAGDDPDVTHGSTVYAKVSFSLGEGFVIDGGEGVGRVTKPGLSSPVGSAAINPVPRKMIEEEVRTVCEEAGYKGGIEVIISIPAGVELARKTFNPRLGIVGGISILGTSGIVEPMSEKAMFDSVKVEIDVLFASGAKDIIITPGNYGRDFLDEHTDLPWDIAVKCSNFVGDSVKYAHELGFRSIFLLGHIGKFVKLAAGVTNTHSSYGDNRSEVFTAHAATHGVDREHLLRLMDAATSDDCIDILDEVGAREEVLHSIIEKIDFHINAFVYGEVEIGALIFSNKHGVLGMTSHGEKIFERLVTHE